MNYEELMALEARIASMCGLEFKEMPKSRNDLVSIDSDSIRPEDGRRKGQHYLDAEARIKAHRRQVRECYKRIRADPVRHEIQKAYDRDSYYIRKARLTEAEKQARRERSATQARVRYQNDPEYRAKLLLFQKQWRDSRKEELNAKIRERRKNNGYEAYRKKVRDQQRLAVLIALEFKMIQKTDYAIAKESDHEIGILARELSFKDWRNRMRQLRKEKCQ